MDENASPEPFLGRNRKLRTHIQVVTSPRTPKQGKAGIKSVAYFFSSYRDVRWEIVFYRKTPRNPPDLLYGMEPVLPQGQFRKCVQAQNLSVESERRITRPCFFCIPRTHPPEFCRELPLSRHYSLSRDIQHVRVFSLAQFHFSVASREQLRTLLHFLGLRRTKPSVKRKWEWGRKYAPYFDWMWKMSGLTHDVTAETISRDQTISRNRRQEIFHFPF